MGAGTDESPDFVFRRGCVQHTTFGCVLGAVAVVPWAHLTPLTVVYMLYVMLVFLFFWQWMLLRPSTRPNIITPTKKRHLPVFRFFLCYVGAGYWDKSTFLLLLFAYIRLLYRRIVAKPKNGGFHVHHSLDGTEA